MRSLSAGPYLLRQFKLTHPEKLVRQSQCVGAKQNPEMADGRARLEQLRVFRKGWTRAPRGGLGQDLEGLAGSEGCLRMAQACRREPREEAAGGSGEETKRTGGFQAAAYRADVQTDTMN